MRRRVGLLFLACSIALPASGGHVVKIRGKLKSYSDKDITVIDAEGKKKKIPLANLILNKNQDLSRMLDKENEFLYAPDIERDLSKTGF